MYVCAHAHIHTTTTINNNKPEEIQPTIIFYLGETVEMISLTPVTSKLIDDWLTPLVSGSDGHKVPVSLTHDRSYYVCLIRIKENK